MGKYILISLKSQMNKGIFYTSCFSKISKSKGYRISVCRFLPKNTYRLKLTLKLKGLSPSEDLLSKWNNRKVTWRIFEHLYKKELEINTNDEIMLVKEILDRGQNITVYCYEEANQHCHRHVLGEILSRLGYEVIEIS